MPWMAPAFGLANGAGRRVRKTECPAAAFLQNSGAMRCSMPPSGPGRLPRHSDKRAGCTEAFARLE